MYREYMYTTFGEYSRMELLDQALNQLGYSDASSGYAGDPDELCQDPAYGHLYRRAAQRCGLQGVYLLRRSERKTGVPAVYVCQAENDGQARKIHRSVWNQDTVPLLIVVSPTFIRLYNGFDSGTETQRGLLKEVDQSGLSRLNEALGSLTARSIDSGRVWEDWGAVRRHDQRLEGRFLKNLRGLDEVLRNDGLDRTASHGLIGKFIYLRYLRDREILSDDRLEKWGIMPAHVFSRDARLTAFWALDGRLREELNGSIFPLEPKRHEILKAHLQQVAGVFAGDDPNGQLSLDFELYDFSFIPTELLSTVYEQFLHETAEGSKSGAYYTPLTLVNFVLDELDEKRPLEEGMTVLDPSCGSGAFLVQCYRRLIGRKRRQIGQSLKPRELRSLLEDHIYGMDRDGDACRITELSLLLTLLDAVETRTVLGSGFKLPKLCEKNIIEADAFDEDSEAIRGLKDMRFDRVVGNPPWAKIPNDSEEPARKWLKQHKKRHPVSNDSLAEAFAWRTHDFAKDGAEVGLLLPAMTLFKHAGKPFRQRFFEENDVWAVVNFSNMRKILFPGADHPCAAFFFRSQATPHMDATILTYAPFVVNQPANRAEKGRGGKAAWNLVVNASELREIPIEEARLGDSLVWKTAMWGSGRDLALLRRLRRRFPTFGEFSEANGLAMHEGPQIRHGGTAGVVHVPELVGKRQVLMQVLKSCGRLFGIPEDALRVIPPGECFARKRGGLKPLDVCRSPQIIVDAARRFAVFSNESLVVPPRQLGIAGKEEQADLLRAIALFLSSDFVTYQQFFASTEWGIRADRATKETLHELPIPFGDMDSSELHDWARLYAELQEKARTGDDSDTQEQLLGEANRRVNKALGLRKNEIALIRDFLVYRKQLIEGRVPHEATSPASDRETQAYAKHLRDELDAFVADSSPLRHAITVYRGEENRLAVVEIEAVKKAGRPIEPEIHSAVEPLTEIARKVQNVFEKHHRHWLYYERGLRIYDRNTIYLFKPNERLHFLESQALVDADDLLSEILTARGAS